MKIRYLHLSDLHLASFASKGPVQAFNQDVVGRSMIKAIKDLGLNFDFIVITGDIARTGQADEYEVCRVFCDALLEVTGLDRQRLLIVPGNHDVDRLSVTKKHIKSFYAFDDQDDITETFTDPDIFPILMRKFESYNVFAAKAIGSKRFEDPAFRIAETLRLTRSGETCQVGLTGLNSCLFAGYDGDDGQKLALGLYQVNPALELITAADVSIAFFHHPFSCYHPCDKVCRNLLMKNFDLILTGHLHDPSNQFTQDAAGQAVIIGAGAGYETREHHNSFNIVELDTNTDRGKVQFYKYLPDHNTWKWDTDVNPSENDGSFYFDIGRGIKGRKKAEAGTDEGSESHWRTKRIMEVKDSQVGVIGDHARIDGGIHYHGDHGKDDPQKLRFRYLNDLASETNNLPWANLDPDHADPSRGESLGLADIYTSLDTSELEHMDTEDQVRDYLVRQKEARRISAQEMLNIHQKLVLLGDPGSGKSTLVNFLTHVMAQAGRAENPAKWLSRLKKTGAWDHAILFPIRIILKDFAATWSSEVRDGVKRLLSYLKSTLGPCGLADFWPELYDGLASREQQYLILLDGLDEVPSDLRETVVRTIDNFAEQYRHNRYLVTCRIYAYIGQHYQLKGFQQATLTPFSQEQIESFIVAWYHELSVLGRFNRQEADTRAGQLKQAAFRSDLVGLAERPLLTTVMALLHTFRGQLPDDRVELYQWTVDLLMRRWEARISGEKGLLETLNLPGLKMNNLEAGLYEVAFHVHSQHGNEGSADITEETLLKVLKSYLGGSWDKAEQFVNYVRERAGLLIRHKPGAYRFPHRTFQEYMAACHLVVGTLDYALEASRLVRQDPDRWRIVFILAAGHAARTHRQGQAIAAINALCPKRISDVPETEASDFRIANIAGEALLEIGQIDEKCKGIGDAALGCVREWLVAAMGAHELLIPKERVASGNILSQIGDPRFDSANWYLPGDELAGFIKISASPFLMGTSAQDAKTLLEELPDYFRDSIEREKPQQRVELSEYYIGRYPVTVAQFRVFLQESDHKAFKEWESRNRFDNHPAVYISWQDAVAYCEWLTGQFKDRGWRIQLPTEAQWERAARGAEGWKYPWGDEKIDPNRANYDETGIHSTSPVGCFPGGISPCGVMDLSGNVFEWCRDWFGSYYYAKSPSKDPSGPSKGSARVIRGGAWYNLAGNCRSACRGSDRPGNRLGNQGFRLVLLPGQPR